MCTPLKAICTLFFFFCPDGLSPPFNESLAAFVSQHRFHHHNHPCRLGCCRFLHNVHTKTRGRITNTQKKPERKAERKLYKTHTKEPKRAKKTAPTAGIIPEPLRPRHVRNVRLSAADLERRRAGKTRHE